MKPRPQSAAGNTHLPAPPPLPTRLLRDGWWLVAKIAVATGRSEMEVTTIVRLRRTNSR